MTDQNDCHLPTAALTTAGEKLARLGLDCPWVGENAWCDLHTETIVGMGFGPMPYGYEFGTVDDADVHCPPAVAAAVVWFAGEVRAWFCRTQPKDTYTTARIGWGRYTKYDSDEHVHVDDGEGWMWQLRAGEVPTRTDTQHAAAAALIIAVADTLEGE